MPDFRFMLPTMMQLTITQQIALVSSKPTLVTGGPGSGKTVVSVRRLLRLAATRNVKLFTYNRTLMAAIRGLARVENFDSSIVESFYDWYYKSTSGFLSQDNNDAIRQKLKDYAEKHEQFDEIIFDEAQDFEPKVINSMNLVSELVSCGADKDQDIRNNYDGDAENQIAAILRTYQEFEPHILDSNFRNTREIFSFARGFVPNNPRPHQLNVNRLSHGDTPEVYDKLTENQQLKKILEIVRLNNHNANIGILVHFKRHIKLIKTFFNENDIDFSYYYSGMPKMDQLEMEDRLQTPFIATFASCKGLEFDIVIMPFFEEADFAIEKGWATQNHYYVASTRAKRQLFVFYDSQPNVMAIIDRDKYRLNGENDLFDF